MSGHDTAAPHPTSNRWPDRLEVAIVSLLAAVPVLATAARAAGSWRPVGDTTAITLRSSDVFSSHSPLVGMPTTLSDAVGQVLHHPGPIEFWVIALGQLASDHRIVPMIAVVAVNVAAIVAIVAMAGWCGGRNARLVAGLLIGLCAWSLRGDAVIDPYNPYAAWLPLGAFAVALVVLLHGRLWALPIAAAAGSYAAQSHVSLLVPVTVTTLVALLLAVANGLRTAGGVRELIERTRVGIRSQARPVGVGVAVLLVCWSPVLIDLLFGKRNVVTLVRATGSDGPTLGLSRAWQVVARAITSPPWLVDDRMAFETVAAVTDRQQAVAAVIIAVSLGIAVAHWRRHQLALAATIVIALSGLAGGMLAASRIPGGIFAAFALHNYLWLWPFTALLWAGIILGGGALILERAGRDATTADSWSRWSRPLTLGLSCLLIGLAVVSAVQPPVRASVLAGRHAPATGSLGSQLGEEIEPGSTVAVRIDPELDQSAVAMGLILELERRGIDARVDPSLGGAFGSHRVRPSGPVDDELVVVVGRDGPPVLPDDVEILATYEPTTARSIELARANQAILDRIDADGGLVVGIDAVEIEGDDAARLVRSGDLVGLGRLGLIISPQIPADEFARYANAQEGPILHVAVYRAPQTLGEP